MASSSSSTSSLSYFSASFRFSFRQLFCCFFFVVFCLFLELFYQKQEKTEKERKIQQERRMRKKERVSDRERERESRYNSSSLTHWSLTASKCNGNRWEKESENDSGRELDLSMSKYYSEHLIRLPPSKPKWSSTPAHPWTESTTKSKFESRNSCCLFVSVGRGGEREAADYCYKILYTLSIDDDGMNIFR